MDTAQSRRAATLAVAGTVVVLLAMASLWLRGRSWDVQYGLYVFHNGPTAMLFFWLGPLVLRRQPGNRVGWVLVVIGTLGALHVAVAATADVALVRWGYVSAIRLDHDLAPADLPLSASLALFLMNWLWVPQPLLIVALLPLIFPDGRLPGPRWRTGLWLTGTAGVLLIAATMADAWPTSTWTVASGPPGWIIALFAAGGVTALAATLVAMAGMVVRWRQTPLHRRQPFRLVGSAIALFALVALATYPWPRLWTPAVLVALYIVLAAYGLAAARFRLHELEPVLARRTAASAVALVATVLFVCVVVALGMVVSAATESRWLPLVVVGAAVAATAEPVRRGVHHLIDRVVYRLTAERTEVVSQISLATDQVSTTDDLMSGVVDALLRGTGASRVEAWLGGDGTEGLVAAAGTATTHDVTLAEPFVSHGETFGELRLLADVRGDLAPGAPELLADVARMAGDAIRNDRLSAALVAQFDELRASRRRLVEAQDTARRGIERDLHDGAQAQLISLRMRIGALQAALDQQHAPAVAADLTEIATGIDEAVGTLRDLARGLQPPVLDQDGVEAALRAYARTLPTPVSIEATGFTRYDEAIEGALYFACLEAIQNVLKHSGASLVTIRLDADSGSVRFEVTDDGCGFDAVGTERSGLQNIEDRLGALDGRIDVHSTPDRGTTVVGSVPVRLRDAQASTVNLARFDRQAGPSGQGLRET